MTSLRKAINQHCKSCTYDPAAPGTWRQQVNGCSVELCSLWDVRAKPSYSISCQSISEIDAKLADSQERRRGYAIRAPKQ